MFRLHASHAASLSLLAAAPLASAHPGHDTAPALGLLEGLVHLLTQPDHVATLVGGVMVAVLALRALRARQRSR